VGLTTRQKVMATGPMLQEAFGSTNPQELFLNGKLAMLVTGGGNTALIAQAVQAQNLPLAYAPLPTFNAVGAGQSLDHNALVTGARHPDAAWTYIKWSADTPNWSISRGNLPARVDQVDAWAKELYPGALATQMRLDVYKDSLRAAGRKDPLSMLPTYDQMDMQLIAPALDKLFAGEAAAATALRDLKGPLQALVPKDLA
jgi:ABC-type glycerol-3-phosphate transport system substrate-binding protein